MKLQLMYSLVGKVLISYKGCYYLYINANCVDSW